MVNDLNDNHHKKPKLAIKDSNSSPLTQITDNPLDDFSNCEDETNNSTGIISPPPFYTKRPNRLDKTAQFEFFPKRKQSFHHETKTKLPHSIHQQYKIQHYQLIQLSIQILVIVPLKTLLSKLTMKALSKLIPNEDIIFLHHLFKHKPIYLSSFPPNTRTPKKERTLRKRKISLPCSNFSSPCRNFEIFQN